ncbi:MAG: PAS domain S-box protein [Pedosphaera sp.]|nr:PAS domain S-box protein [Pedosphaera sp.]
MKFLGNFPLRQKLGLVIVFACGVVLLLGATALFGYQAWTVRDRAVKDIQLLASMLGSSIRATIDLNRLEQAEKTLASLEARKEVVAAGLYLPSGSLFASYVRSGTERFRFPGLNAAHPWSDQLRFVAGGAELFQPIVFEREVVGVVYLRYDTDSLYTELPRLAIMGAAMLGVLLLVSIAVAGALQRVVSRPVLQLVEAARQVTENQDYRVRVDKLADDEIGLLTQSFNEMLATVEARDASLEERGRELQHELIERRKAEAELYANELQFRTVIESSPVAMMVVSERGDVIYLNPKFSALFGYTRREIGDVESWLKRAFPDEKYRSLIRAAWHDRVSKTSRTISPIAPEELTVKCADGSVRQVESNSSTVQERTVLVFADLTERKQAEAGLRESEERYRLLVENSSDLVAEITMDGVLRYASPNFKTQLGLDPAELIGTNAFARVHPEDLPNVLPKMGLPDATATYRYQHGDGTWRWFEASGRRYRASNGEDRGVVINRDVTQRKQAEDQEALMQARLRQSQKMEAIGTLAGGIAHDFNNILTGIMGYAEICRLDLPAGHPAARSITEVLTAAHRAKDLVARILTFSRRHEQKRLVIQLRPVILDAVKLLRASLPSSIQIRTEISPDAPPALADPTQIHQIIMNLATNAAHAMRANGGVLSIREDVIECGETQRDEKLQLRSGPYLRLRVEDTGVGMSVETLERIFEPFFTTKAAGEGTGLGLAVVHGIMQEHEGDVTVKSEPGNGTTFELYFPVANSIPVQVEERASIIIGGNGQSILLVEDEVKLAQLGRQQLEHLGYKVTSTSDPRQALDWFQNNPAAFDAILTDLTMPHMSGISLAEICLKLRPNIPVLLVTGFGGGAEAARVNEIGIREVLKKPYTIEGLGTALQRAFAKNPTTTG